MICFSLTLADIQKMKLKNTIIKTLTIAKNSGLASKKA
jgi:hypothetical protein